ncbi:MORN motif repeat containing protein [Babesia caballi]|uniref:MORN motif repeat containing protein n=1 Tax=Babesia caballi TaxID=5871 RepID=A0AAV4M1Z0_BABCB|nr:MORN motif repeat containing protein [Babesia caballi]
MWEIDFFDETPRRGGKKDPASMETQPTASQSAEVQLASLQSPAAPESAFQPLEQPFTTTQPAGSQPFAFQHAGPQFTAPQPAGAQFASIQSAGPQYTTIQPPEPQFVATQVPGPQFAAVQPAGVQFTTIQPAVTQFATIQPATVQFATIQPAVPQFTTIQTTGPQFAATQVAGPQFTAVQPAAQQFAVPQQAGAQYTTFQTVGTPFATTQPAGPNFAASQPTKSHQFQFQPPGSQFSAPQPAAPQYATVRRTTQSYGFRRSGSDDHANKLAAPQASTLRRAGSHDDALQHPGSQHAAFRPQAGARAQAGLPSDLPGTPLGLGQRTFGGDLDDLSHIYKVIGAPAGGPAAPFYPAEAPLADDSAQRMAVYDTALHGPPIVGATIVRHESQTTHVDFAYPTRLQHCLNPPLVSRLRVNNSNNWTASGVSADRQLEQCFYLVPRLALGAMNDTSLVDFVYFTLPTASGNYLYGVSYVARFERQPSMPKTDDGTGGANPYVGALKYLETARGVDLGVKSSTETGKQPHGAIGRTRSYYFIAICVISKVPFFCHIGCKLECIAQTYFNNKCFYDHQMLVSFVDHLNSADMVENWSYESLYFNLESYFKPVVMCMSYRAILFIVKSILTNLKIAVFSRCAARTSTAILALLTMIPGASTLGFNSKCFGSLWHSWKKFAMPLHLFHSNNVLFPYFTPEMLPLINGVSGYLIGITDMQLLKRLEKMPDMVVNLEVNCVQLLNGSLLEMYHPSLYESQCFENFLEPEYSSEDEDLVRTVADTGVAIYGTLGSYLAKTPSTFINISSSINRAVASRSRFRGAIKCNESALGLLDKYFPGAVPEWLKKCAVPPAIANQNANEKAKLSANLEQDAAKAPTQHAAFTVQDMFNKMRTHRNHYHYLGYIDYIQGFKENKDRIREIEYAINNRVNPMQEYLLRFFTDAAYVCGERRLMCQLLMDFSFSFSTLTDCSQPVTGVVIKRGDTYLRGSLPESDVVEPGLLDFLMQDACSCGLTATVFEEHEDFCKFGFGDLEQRPNHLRKPAAPDGKGKGHDQSKLKTRPERTAPSSTQKPKKYSSSISFTKIMSFFSGGKSKTAKPKKVNKVSKSRKEHAKSDKIRKSKLKRSGSAGAEDDASGVTDDSDADNGARATYSSSASGGDDDSDSSAARAAASDVSSADESDYDSVSESASGAGSDAERGRGSDSESEAESAPKEEADEATEHGEDQDPDVHPEDPSVVEREDGYASDGFSSSSEAAVQTEYESEDQSEAESEPDDGESEDESGTESEVELQLAHDDETEPRPEDFPQEPEHEPRYDGEPAQEVEDETKDESESADDSDSQESEADSVSDVDQDDQEPETAAAQADEQPDGDAQNQDELSEYSYQGTERSGLSEEDSSVTNIDDDEARDRDVTSISDDERVHGAAQPDATEEEQRSSGTTDKAADATPPEETGEAAQQDGEQPSEEAETKGQDPGESPSDEPLHASDGAYEDADSHDGPKEAEDGTITERSGKAEAEDTADQAGDDSTRKQTTADKAKTGDDSDTGEYTSAVEDDSDLEASELKTPEPGSDFEKPDKTPKKQAEGDKKGETKKDEGVTGGKAKKKDGASAAPADHEKTSEGGAQKGDGKEKQAEGEHKEADHKASALQRQRRAIRRNIRQSGDQEISFEVIGSLATKIMELQRNHSIDFIEMWLKTQCARKFFEEHQLDTFSQPVFLTGGTMAKQKYPNGDVYIGDLIHMKRHGKGTYIAVDGTVYEGDWSDGNRHGVGTLTSSKQGYKYYGEWANDKREGSGELQTPLFIYTGEFNNNTFNGKGKLVNAGGDQYEGDFKDGKYNGRGKLTQVDGTVKIGYFRNNELCGVCSMIKTDGRIYVGKLHGDVLHGSGKLIYNNFVTFEGQWDRGIRDGQGAVTIKMSEKEADGVITIEGLWRDDYLVVTEVLLKFPSGCKYVGPLDVCTSLRKMIYTASYDESLYGEAEEVFQTFDNRLLPHGKGIMKTASGSTFDGDFLNGMRHGYGDMIFPNGVAYSGRWAFGAVHGPADVTFPGEAQPTRLHFNYGELVDPLNSAHVQYMVECLNELLHALGHLPTLDASRCKPTLEEPPIMYATSVVKLPLCTFRFSTLVTARLIAYDTWSMDVICGTTDLAMAARSARSVCSEWDRFCSSLQPALVSRALNRIALNFARLSHEISLKRDPCVRAFLERHVIRAVAPSFRFEGQGHLALQALIQPLQQRALLLGRSGALQPKDASLVLNAYAKIYQSAQQPPDSAGSPWRDIPRQLRGYVSQMVPVARSLVPRMNEQDLSLVLNCVSKMGVPADELLTVANSTLANHLHAHYRRESSTAGEPQLAEHNLISQLTPQGASLVVNCFAKYTFPLNEAVFNHILHRFIPEHLHRFLPQQLVVLLHGFLRLNVPLRDVRPALNHLDRLVSADGAWSNPKLLSASLYTFGKYNFLPTETARVLNTATPARLRCSELELGNVYYGLGKLNMRCERFLARLGETLTPMLHQLTPQGLSTVYYALARLEVRERACGEECRYGSVQLPSALLRKFEELVANNQVRATRRHATHTGGMPSTQVLPLHLVNVCFSAATGLVADAGPFTRLLEHLAFSFARYQGMPPAAPTDAGHSSAPNGHQACYSHAESADSRVTAASGSVQDEASADRRTHDFLTAELGTQGIYQLYCICQHIKDFTPGGLVAQRLEVLTLLRRLFDAWDRISANRPRALISEDPDHAAVLVDPDITTSKIQTSVFSFLKAMHIPATDGKDQTRVSAPSTDASRVSQTLVVEESHAPPYVIDILLHSV